MDFKIRVNFNRPVVFPADRFSLKEIKNKLRLQKLRVEKIIDTYINQLEDLFLIRNPKYRFNKNYSEDFKKFVKNHQKNKSLSQCGNWVYFPWNNLLIHYLKDNLHQELRLARNRNLITKEEQKIIYNKKIGIAGLSVGSNCAIALAFLGVGKFMKLADPDIIDPSNLNRILLDFTNVGLNKAEAISRFIYQLNPYSRIEIFKEGVTEKNLGRFLNGIDLLIEELDNIEMKIKIREECRKRKIPLVMATDNGDNVIIDIERYDLNSNYPIFHGNLNSLDLSDVNTNVSKMYKVMAKIINLNLVPLRVLKSVEEVGKTLYSWPQIVTAAMMSGAITAYVVKEILLGKKIKSGKYDINIEKIFDPDFKKIEKLRKKELKKFQELFNI